MDRALRAGLLPFMCGMVGILLAVIENQLYSSGILIDEFITGSVTITDLMAVTIIFWVIIGIILAAIRS